MCTKWTYTGPVVPLTPVPWNVIPSSSLINNACVTKHENTNLCNDSFLFDNNNNKKLSCRRETARCLLRAIGYFAKSLDVTQGH